jgi:hypothetical protein
VITKLHSTSSATVAEFRGEKLLVRTPGDFLSLMMEAREHGASVIALHEANIDPSFFQLRTGLAGEILQKVANYRFRFAVIGDISRYTESSESLQALVRECNRGNDVAFALTLDEVLAK